MEIKYTITKLEHLDLALTQGHLGPLEENKTGNQRVFFINQKNLSYMKHEKTKIVCETLSLLLIIFFKTSNPYWATKDPYLYKK